MPRIRFTTYHPNMEQRPRPRRALPLLGKDGPVYDISSLPAPELDHICCCDPAIAMCGAIVAGTGVVFGKPEHSLSLCPRCADLDAAGKKCGAPMCPGVDREL